MTEQEWLTCSDPQPMLEFLRGKASDRKLRLFAVACCRRIWPTIVDERSRMAVDAAESYADGLTNDEKLADVADLANDASNEAADPYVDSANVAACHAADARYYPSSAAAFVALPGNIALLVHEATIKAAYSVSLQTNSACADRNEATACANRAETAERLVQVAILHDIFGNPFRPHIRATTWLTSNVATVANSIYQEKEFDQLPILADALEDAGCTSKDILRHLRGGGEHVRGCWTLDLVLGKT